VLVPRLGPKVPLENLHQIIPLTHLKFEHVPKCLIELSKFSIPLVDSWPERL
jgi:hypothetical protein